MANFSNVDVSNDTIFITGLPEDTTEAQLAEYFGQIGIIKFDKKNECPKIWIYKDKTTGKGKGEATITYDDPPTATSAINWFNGKEFRGSSLSIELAQRKSAPQFSRGGGAGGRGGRGSFRGDGGGGRGGGYDRGPRDDSRGGGGGRSGPGRPGDWLCPSCSNNNFAYRQECNRCRTQKPAGASADGGASGGSGGGGSHYNGSSRHQYDDSSSGGYGSRSAGSNHRDNDLRDRGREANRDRDRERGRENRDSYRDRDRNSDRDRDRGRGSGYGGSGGGGGGGGGGYGRGSASSGPSRSYTRDKEDRRSRPY